MANPTCVLCDARGFEDTHLCRKCLLKMHPPVSAASVASQTLSEPMGWQPKPEVWSIVGITLGCVVAALLVVVAVVLFV